MTVHKSQGSQFDTAAVLLPDPASPILTRELLYTAVTRAQDAAHPRRHGGVHPRRRRPPDRPGVRPAPTAVGLTTADMIEGIPGTPFEDEVLIRRRRWASDETGFAIIDADRAGDEIVLVGTIGHLEERERVRISGQWQDDRRYGLQVKVATAEPLAPSGEAALLAYLKRVKHVGGGRAEKLLARYGEDVLDTIDHDPPAAFRALGLSPKRINEAVKSWDGLRSSRALHLMLAPHGLAWLVPRIEQHYGPRAHRIVRERPYDLTSVFGIGFQTADTIARSLDVPRRLTRTSARGSAPRLERGGAGRVDLPAGARSRHAGRRAARRRPDAAAVQRDGRRRRARHRARRRRRGLGLPARDSEARARPRGHRAPSWPPRRRASRPRAHHPPTTSSPHPSRQPRSAPRSPPGSRSSPAARARARPQRSG